MLERLHPFTSLAVLLLATGLVMAAMGEPVAGAFAFATAHGFALLEFKKYTSRFQFSMMLFTALALGALLDLGHGEWPLLTAGLLACATAAIARQAFMQRFTYVNLLWVDTGLAIAGAALCAAGILGQPFSWDLWIAPLLPVGFALGLTLSYVQDAQHMRKRTRFGYKVQAGMPAHDFTLPDQDGRPVSLSDYKGRHPVLLIFVRGDWCPGCHMMLRTYERHRERFLEKGVHVLGIGPDDISVNKDMVRRIGVGYRMLSDDTQEVSSRYGVVYTNPIIEQGVDYAEGIPLPASFLVDANGTVRYVSRPDRVGEFLDPELIFGALEGLPAAPVPAWS